MGSVIVITIFLSADDQIVAKVVPLFNVSPYYIGYRLAQADTPKRMRAIAEEIRQHFERSNLAHSN